MLLYLVMPHLGPGGGAVYSAKGICSAGGGGPSWMWGSRVIKHTERNDSLMVARWFALTTNTQPHATRKEEGGPSVLHSAPPLTVDYSALVLAQPILSESPSKSQGIKQAH